MTLRRRDFLKRAGTLTAASWLAHAAVAPRRAHARLARKLVRDPNGLLDLPPGFSYRVISRMGDPMSDGYRVPGRPDAMGVFPGEPGTFVVMRNHELPVGANGIGPLVPGQLPPKEAYDPDAAGGVTRLVIDEKTLEVKAQNLVLTGTYWNCAGGLSPWGWLTCEELFAPKHGYVFLCDPSAKSVASPKRIPSYGRFRHEAATVDPRTLIAYLTEDDPDAAFYRFVPKSASTPFDGKLQALAVEGKPYFDASTMVMGQRLRVSWIDVPEADPDIDSVRHQAHERGAASFRRNEGLWLAGDDVFFTATTGGPIGRGQIFRLRIKPDEQATLELVVQTNDTSDLDMPDNLTMSPHGQLYVAEDGFDSNYLRRITLSGDVIDFAHCAGSATEFAGPCFAPDGNTLFVNLQTDGLTVAIRGPFAQEAEVLPDAPTAPDDDAGGNHGDDEDAGREGSASGRPRARRAHHEPDHEAGCKGGLGLGGGLAVLAFAALSERKRRRGG